MASSTKVEQAYQYILQEMLNLNYRAGDRLVIRQIAKRCHVSEIPVREALRKLENDGYVRLIPNQGAVALGLDINMIVGFVQIKGVLEGFATRLSIDCLSGNDLAELHKINLEIREAVSNHEAEKVSALNEKFHMAIYAHIPNKALTNSIADLWDKGRITKQIFSKSVSVMEQSYDEHEEILRLIENRRYNEVEEYVRAHKLKAIPAWTSMGVLI